MAVKHRFNNITKSEEDKRLYRGLLLDNGMKIVVISDETTDKSAVCIDVAVGELCTWTKRSLSLSIKHIIFSSNTLKLGLAPPYYVKV